MNTLQLLLAFAALSVTVWAQGCSRLPRNLNLTANPRLPSPFTFYNGRPVRTAAQWNCRREEISELFQRLESGEIPPKPRSVSGSISKDDNSITVKVTHRRRTISFTASIKYPEEGKGPFPAIIALGGTTVPIPSNVATIIIQHDQIAQQQSATLSRGVGLFYDLYGKNHTASAMAAWVWGTSRLIDALEDTSRRHRINTRRLAVTGCSRNGKGTLMVGAFEPRIVLTIPQESGTGGAGCWRLAKDLQNRGENVQTAPQIVTENVWFTAGFANLTSRVDDLPFDHHLLTGLVAPRGLFVIDHAGINWLGPKSTYGCSVAGRKVYEALGAADHMGVSITGNHNHCQFPEDKTGEYYTAFIDKFLFRNSSADTDIVYSDVDLGFKEEDWIDWKVPKLAK
ncbi:hypothetical protein FA15DRAFT_692229 [Coprinopsis marcescibilis]|uniref:(4-O-methyl)-D-glucuronate--lignin esterase n=1 Tax=Coprinopsis marcescibilis TaxID=230819 RepID=A0A5C3L4P6_COPMA|nr:hypothetical protein FA15DRAFT_692229 [Coprinopsis marcescibilis]